MEQDEAREVDALCPECGHAFKAYVDRILPGAADAPPRIEHPCPQCGCRECRLR